MNNRKKLTALLNGDVNALKPEPVRAVSFFLENQDGEPIYNDVKAQKRYTMAELETLSLTRPVTVFVPSSGPELLEPIVLSE